jgi:hypothetical protein
VARIFRREKRTSYSWGQDPAYTVERSGNPLDWLHSMFCQMDAVGYGFAARAGIKYLESALDPVDLEPVAELLPTVQDELLADYRAVSEFQQAIEQGSGFDEVDRLKAAAMDEIERTYAKYLKVKGDERS